MDQLEDGLPRRPYRSGMQTTCLRKCGNNFGSANNAVTVPNYPVTQYITMDQLDGHLENMAAAVTNKKYVLGLILNNKAALVTTTTTNQYFDTKKLLGEVKSFRNTSSSYSRVTTPNKTKLLQAAIRFKHTPCGFCSTDVRGFSPSHDITS